MSGARPRPLFGHRVDELYAIWSTVAPTIYREAGYRFFFFSREEARTHVHVAGAEGEAKFWLEPQLELAKNYRLSRAQLREIEQIIEAHEDEFRAAWDRHFNR